MQTQFFSLKGQWKDKDVKELQILYQSDSFLVVNKTYDIRINSDDPSHTCTIETQLKGLLPHLVDPSVGHSFRFVHRLDYATSGLLCIALNKDAAKKASKLFADRQTIKHYIALVRGHVSKWENGIKEITVSIGKDTSEIEAHKFCTSDSESCAEAKSAHTTFVILEYGTYDGNPATKLLLIPHSGRSHQLRVHCAHIGHVIVGDYTYSNRQDNKPFRMMLHALRLNIPIPTENLSVQTEDPFTSNIDGLWHTDEIVQTYENLRSKIKHV